MVRHWRDSHDRNVLEGDVKQLLSQLISSFKNRFEQRIAAQYTRAKKFFGYETERIPYTIEGKYIPDFTGEKIVGGKMYVETKGYFRPESKRKMVAVKKQHPELDIRIIFYSARKQYIRWAERYGFPYAIGKMPKEWLDELKTNEEVFPT